MSEACLEVMAKGHRNMPCTVARFRWAENSCSPMFVSREQGRRILAGAMEEGIIPSSEVPRLSALLDKTDLPEKRSYLDNYLHEAFSTMSDMQDIEEKLYPEDDQKIGAIVHVPVERWNEWQQRRILNGPVMVPSGEILPHVVFPVPPPEKLN